MLGLVLALLAAFFNGFSMILTRDRIGESNFFSASLVATVIGNIILWPLALLFANWDAINLQSFLVFAMAGILAPAILRLIFNRGIETLGASLTSSIITVNPLFTVMLAILFLGEVLVREQLIGIACIVVGLVFFFRRTGKLRHENNVEKASKNALLLLLLGALIVSFSHILRKYALNISNEPLFGVATSYSFALLVYLLLVVTSRSARGFLRLDRDFRCFWKAGVFVTIGWIMTFYALSLEKASVVSPLTQTYPLFVILLAYLYLKGKEDLSRQFVVGCFLVVTGVVLVGAP